MVVILWKIVIGFECLFFGLLSCIDVLFYGDDEELVCYEDNFWVKILFVFNLDSGFEMFELMLLNVYI